MEITAKVSQINQGTTRRGRSAGQPFWTVVLNSYIRNSDGDRFTVFEASKIENLKEGQEYTFTLEENNNYLNLVEFFPVVQEGYLSPKEYASKDDTTDTSQSHPAYDPPFDDNRTPKDVFISRMSSTKTIGDILARSAVIADVTQEGLLNLIENVIIPCAQRLDRYHKSGE